MAVKYRLSANEIKSRLNVMLEQLYNTMFY